MSDNTVELDLCLMHATAKAWLVSDGDIKVWLPKSKVELVQEGSRYSTFLVPEWLAIEKGLV